MHPGRLPLRTKLVVFNVGTVAVTLAVLVGLDLAFERVRINGPLYRAIDGGQAVVADILPPPLYIVESHLAVFELIDAQAHGDTARVGLLESRLREREAEFEARHQQWMRELAPGIVKSALVDASYAPAATYFRVVDRDLLAGERVEADQILGDLRARARRAGIATPLVSIACIQLDVYQRRRNAR